MEKRLQPYKHQCSVSQEGSYTALGMKACSKVKKQKSTFPFLLLKNVAKISAEIAQSIVIFSFLCMLRLSISGRWWRNHCWEWVPWKCQCRALGCFLLWLCPSTDYSSYMFRVKFIDSHFQSWLPFKQRHLNIVSESPDSERSKQRSSVLGWPYKRKPDYLPFHDS